MHVTRASWPSSTSTIHPTVSSIGLLAPGLSVRAEPEAPGPIAAEIDHSLEVQTVLVLLPTPPSPLVPHSAVPPLPPPLNPSRCKAGEPASKEQKRRIQTTRIERLHDAVHRLHALLRHRVARDQPGHVLVASTSACTALGERVQQPDRGPHEHRGGDEDDDHHRQRRARSRARGDRQLGRQQVAELATPQPQITATTAPTASGRAPRGARRRINAIAPIPQATDASTARSFGGEAVVDVAGVLRRTKIPATAIAPALHAAARARVEK